MFPLIYTVCLREAFSRFDWLRLAHFSSYQKEKVPGEIFLLIHVIGCDLSLSKYCSKPCLRGICSCCYLLHCALFIAAKCVNAQTTGACK